MWIYDIPRNSELVLTVKDEHTTLDFKTTAKESLGNNGIWVEIIRTSQGKTIDFSGRPVSLALNRKGRKPIVWDPVSVKMLRVNGELRQAILCSTEGVEINRRKVYRQTVDMPAKAVLNGDEMNVIVHDVGAAGFSAISEIGSNRHGTGIHIECSYQDGEDNVFLTGKVIRVQDMPDGTVCYGCRYTGRTDVIVNYIRRKKKEMQEP